MTVLSFQDAFVVEIEGSGSLGEELTEYYDRLTQADTDRRVDLTCKVGALECDPDKVLGKPTDYFGRNGKWFISVDKYKKIRIKRDWSEIHFSTDVPRSWAYRLIEYRARVALADRGQTLIHASGAVVNDRTVAFPAWRHTGKTNTLITLLNEFDGNYLSDDRLWVGEDGVAHGFPLPINMQPYNYNSFPGMEPPTRLYDLRYRLRNEIRERTSESGPFFSQALYFVNEFYIAPPSEKARIEEIHPGVEYEAESPLDALVCLQTVAGDEGTVELTEASRERTVSYLRSISYREWNEMIEEYVTAFDLLFKDESAEEELTALREREMELWSELTEFVDTYILTLPREEQWDDRNLSQRVLKTLSPILS